MKSRLILFLVLHGLIIFFFRSHDILYKYTFCLFFAFPCESLHYFGIKNHSFVLMKCLMSGKASRTDFCNYNYLTNHHLVNPPTRLLEDLQVWFFLAVPIMWIKSRVTCVVVGCRKQHLLPTETNRTEQSFLV